MSARARLAASWSKWTALPPHSPASASARANVRFATSVVRVPAARRLRNTISPIFPAPTSSTVRSPRLSKMRWASWTATEPTEARPETISDPARTRLATESECWKSRWNTRPTVRSRAAASYASFTCAVTWTSPSTMLSSPEATRNRCATASAPSRV